MRIMLGAVISLPPFSPGMAWNWIQHAVGLRELGHDVWFVEEVDPAWWVDGGGRPSAPARSDNRRLFAAVTERFGLTERAVQLERGSGETFGLARADLERAVRGADLLVNMSGHVQSEAVLANVRRRAYVDQDPVYTQLWLSEHGPSDHFDAHDVFLTVGLDIGSSRTHIPDAGIDWRSTLPPVVLDRWPAAPPPPHRPFTTVASWTGYSDVHHDGVWYRAKHSEFARFADLPRRAGGRFQAAIKSWRDDDPEIALLRAGGWELTDASPIGDLDAYRSYIAASGAEIGIAKHAYVRGRSGWFSDRSAHYLATGRPALVQATGFEAHLPTGEGLLAFSTTEEALEAVRTVQDDYERHAVAARRIAEEHLDHRKVLPALLEACTATAPSVHVRTP